MDARELVAHNMQLVSLPEVCIEVQELADSPYSTASDLGAVIGKDPALSARLLRIVNSAYFGLPRRVDTLTRAVNLVGLRELRTLTLAASAAEVFGDIDSRLLDMPTFWQHSVYCGLVAGTLAGAARVLHRERLFTAGLLHDVGRLLMLMKLPQEMAAVMSQYRTADEICRAEAQQVGFDHAEAGGALLEHWNLPATLCAAVRHHHDPGAAEQGRLDAAILHLADRVTHAAQVSGGPNPVGYYDPFRALLASAEHAGEIVEQAVGQARPGAIELTGLTRDALQAAVRDAARDFDSVLDLLYPQTAHR